MKTENRGRQILCSGAPHLPNDWHFLLVENLSSCRSLIRAARQADCLSLGKLLEKGCAWRRGLPGYSAACEADLGRIVADMLGEADARPVPLILFWISLQEAVEDARLQTVFRRSGCSSLGEFLDRGREWRMQLPGYGARSEKVLSETVERILDGLGEEAPRRVGELVCRLRCDPAALCRGLDGADADFPLRLLKTRLLEDVDLMHFLHENQLEAAGASGKPAGILSKQDLLGCCRERDRAGLEIALFEHARRLLEPRHWTPGICDRFVPTWVLDRLVVTSTSSRLLVSRAERYGWRCYRDILHACERVGLYAFDDSIEALLWEEVSRLTRMGPVWDEATDVNAKQDSLLASVRASIDRLSPREALVLTRRMGLDSSGAATLQQLGADLDVTRERVRQIEDAAWKQLRRKEAWSRRFLSKIDLLLEEHCGVLALSKLKEDPWMSDTAGRREALAALLKHIPDRPAFVYPVRNQHYIVELPRTQFDHLRLRIGRLVNQQHFPLPLQALLDRVSSGTSSKVRRPGFTRRFVEVFGPLLEISTDGQVLGFSGSPASLIKGILAASPQPLHFHEIRLQLENIWRERGLADPPALSQVRHILVSHPKILLFGSGRYGLEHHFPEMERLEALCVPAALQLLNCDRLPALQLYRGLLKLGLSLPSWFTHYHLSILLRRCPQAAYHGRLVFSLAEF